MLLIKKARAFEYGGDLEGALSTLREAARWVDRRREPRQHFALCFNELTTLCKLDRHCEAEAGLGRVKALALALGNELDRVRVRWLQGTVASGLGKTAEAVAALDEVRRFFASHGIAFDAALVTLELSMLYLRGRHHAKVRDLAREAVVVFEGHGAHPHALAALRVFAAAAERQQVTAALGGKLIAYLQRARRAPDLRFEA